MKKPRVATPGLSFGIDCAGHAIDIKSKARNQDAKRGAFAKAEQALAGGSTPQNELEAGLAEIQAAAAGVLEIFVISPGDAGGLMAHKADEIVRAAGLTWPDILHAEQPGGSKFQSSRRRAVLTPGELLARYGNELTGWERGFLAGLIRRSGRWTSRQSEVFAAIRDRVAGGAK